MESLNEPVFSEDWFQRVRETAALLERAKDFPPAKLTSTADNAENAVVRLRDDLIDRLRQEESPERTERLRRMLDRINTALSLVVGVTYPVAAIHRDMLTQAVELLNRIVEEPAG